MNVTLRNFIALSFLAGVVAGPATAQPGPGGRAGGPHAPLRRETQEYLQATVLPVLRQQRQKLEQELAPADQAQLATYRTQLKELAQREQALRQVARALPRPPAPDSATRLWEHRPAPSAEQLAAFTERREIMHQVAQLGQKYQANITRLLASIQPQQAQWVADLRAIMDKNRPAQLPGDAGRPPASAPHRYWAGPHFSELHHLLRGSAFLLLDPSLPELPDAAPVATSLYPNPVAPTSQLQYELKQAGPVTVTVLDKNGNTLRTVLHAASQAPGPHTEALDLGNLPSGTYFYQVQTPAGTETKRFIKE